ncbi:MAG: alpha/beta fold hydrolase [Motiliproteus sp.]
MSLYVEQSGSAKAPPLVLIHGWGMHSGIWLPWLPLLESHFSVIRVDLPGLGRSSGFAPEHYELATVAEQVAAAVSPLLQQPAIWLGWSLGGLVAAEISRRHETRVKGLVTLASNPSFVQTADYCSAMDTNTFTEFQSQLATDWGKTLGRFIMLMAQGDSQPRALIKQAKMTLELYQQLPPSHLPEALALLQQDQRKLFAGLNAPRLHLFAEQDALVPVSAANDPAVSANAEVIGNAGHLVFLTQPQQLLKLLLDFQGRLHG